MAEPIHSAPDTKDEHQEAKKAMDDLDNKMKELHKKIAETKKQTEELPALRVHKNQLATTIAKSQLFKTLQKNQLDKVSEESHDLTLKVSTMKNEVESKRETVNELRLMVDMYDREAGDQRHPHISRLKLSELRARSEIERLQKELDLHCLESRLRVALERKAKIEKRLAGRKSFLSLMSHKVKESKRVSAQLAEALESKAEDVIAFQAEVETIIDTYEGTIKSNLQLIDQLKEKANKGKELISEKLEAKSREALLATEKRLLDDQMKYIDTRMETQEQFVSILDNQVKSYKEETSKATDEDTSYRERLEEVNPKTDESEKELLTTKMTLEATKTEAEARARQILKIENKLRRERRKRTKMAHDLEATTTMLSKEGTSLGTSSQDAYQSQTLLIEKLEREAQIFRERVKCFICLERNKQVLLTSCYHFFCGPCIQENLKRKRKGKYNCAICGVLFQEHHVKRFYI